MLRENFFVHAVHSFFVALAHRAKFSHDAQRTTALADVTSFFFSTVQLCSATHRKHAVVW